MITLTPHTESQQTPSRPAYCSPRLTFVTRLVDISQCRLFLRLLLIRFGEVRLPVPDGLFSCFVRLSFCFCLGLSLRKLLTHEWRESNDIIPRCFRIGLRVCTVESEFVVVVWLPFSAYYSVAWRAF